MHLDIFFSTDPGTDRSKKKALAQDWLTETRGFFMIFHRDLAMMVINPFMEITLW